VRQPKKQSAATQVIEAKVLGRHESHSPGAVSPPAPPAPAKAAAGAVASVTDPVVIRAPAQLEVSVRAHRDLCLLCGAPGQSARVTFAGMPIRVSVCSSCGRAVKGGIELATVITRALT